MKKSVILSAILLSSLVYTSAEAQISVHIGLNLPVRRVIVAAPQPVETIYDDDFDDSDDYYYLPEVEAYYSIPLGRYFYMDGPRWISAAYLPGAYRSYDWRTARRFEVRGRRPYMNHDMYRNKWGGNPNRGDWSRGGYAARGNNNRNYGYNQPNRNNDGRGNWGGGQPSRGNNGYNQPNRNNDNRGNWGSGQNQPSRGNNGYNQPNRNNDNRGNWGGGQNQPSRGNGGGQQSQPQQPDRNGGGRDRGNAQPSNNGGGRDRGNQGGGSQFAQQGGRPSIDKGGFVRSRN
jgi:hypothetical protein